MFEVLLSIYKHADLKVINALQSHSIPFGGPGSNDLKIDHNLIQIYTEMGTHVSINAQKLRYKLLTVAGFPNTTIRST